MIGFVFIVGITFVIMIGVTTTVNERVPRPLVRCFAWMRRRETPASIIVCAVAAMDDDFILTDWDHDGDFWHSASLKCHIKYGRWGHLWLNFNGRRVPVSRIDDAILDRMMRRIITVHSNREHITLLRQVTMTARDAVTIADRPPPPLHPGANRR